MKWVFQQQYLHIFSNETHTIINNFHPHEVDGRGSEAQFQVGENLDFDNSTWS